MEKTADLCVAVGKYMKDGKEKNRYLNVGCVMKNDKGQFILLNRTFNPAGVVGQEGKESILISIFKKKEAATESSTTAEATWDE